MRLKEFILQHRRVWLLLVVLLAGVLVLLILRAPRNGIDYSPRGSNNRAGPIVVKANEKVDPNSGTYTVSPLVIGDLQIVDNYVIFWPRQEGGFLEKQRYTFSFKDFRTSSGKSLKVPTLRFGVSRESEYSTLQKEVLSKYGWLEESSNPLLNKLPHTEPYRYKISYHINELPQNEGKSTRDVLGDEQSWRQKKANYTVIIETLVFQGRQEDMAAYIREVGAARQAALDWLKEQSVDVSRDIQYVFVPDDATLTQPSSDDAEIELD